MASRPMSVPMSPATTTSSTHAPPYDRRRRARVALAAVGAAASLVLAQTPRDAIDPTPQSLDEFRTAASRILEETGVPGAGLALVHADTIEWAGGLGFADRDARTPVTAETHFRAGSVSKTFVAMALVQLYYDGEVELNAPLTEVAPEIAIDNAWHATDPVRVIHLLEHTAGFDDMHFADRYVRDGAPELPLREVLDLNPRSRIVRWPPGTRFAYSNPGYGLAGYLIETVTGEPFEDYIAREIFEPLAMSTSSFRLRPEDAPLLARGYDSRDGPPVGYPRIHLRPAGNLHTSARELALFVQMLLNWGELGDAFVVDPEYLGNMEHPRTTLAARAGLREGYGSGIAARLDLPYPMLGHGGGIDGFLSSYAYSPSRDVGFVVLLNSIGPGAAAAMSRLSSLATRYLKRGVEPRTPPRATVNAAILEQYAGYYHDAAPRNQIAWPFQWLFGGRTIASDGQGLIVSGLLGGNTRLVPVTETTFRRDGEIDASSVFAADDDGRMVLTGPALYAERVPRWRVEIVRIPVALAMAVLASVFVAALVWLVTARRARPRGFWPLKAALLCCPLVPGAAVLALLATPSREWGAVNAASITVFVTTLSVPLVAGLVALLALFAHRLDASRWLVTYALIVSSAMAIIGLYLGRHELIGLRLWSY